MKREANDMTAIKTMVAQGRYQVDPHLVADALIARLLARAGAGGPPAQSECSNPSSSTSQSMKQTAA